MSNIDFETRVEDRIREEASYSAGVVKAVFEGATRKRNEEDEGFIDVIVLAAKVKANTVLRRVLRA